MPKIKPPPLKAQAEIVQANISSRCAYFGWTTEREIAKRLGMAKSTYHNRADNPLSWGIGELIRAADVLKVPLDWIMVNHSDLREVRK